jgi:hypothetical protein
VLDLAALSRFYLDSSALGLQEKMGFLRFGSIDLKSTDPGTEDEVQLKVMSLQIPGKDIFTKLEVIRLGWRSAAMERESGMNTPPFLGRKGSKDSNRTAARPERGNVPQPLPFQSPLMQQQLKLTPTWVKTPNFYDPCEVEGVLHTAEECGLADSYFRG